MGDYGRELQFGVNVDPTASALTTAREVARRADAVGLDLIGIQDHPYQWRFLDTWMLMATLLAAILKGPYPGYSQPITSQPA